MKKNKGKLEQHLSRYWYLYLLFVLVSSIIWSMAVVFYTKDKKKEIVSIWVASYDANVSELTNKLEDNKPDYLKHVRLTFFNRDSQLLSLAYNSMAVSYDMVVLPETFSGKVALARTYSILDADYLEQSIPSIEYYETNDNKYGIKIYDKNTEDNSLITYAKDGFEKENYYVFLNKKSLHMGEINKSQYDGGIQVLKTLLDK